MSQLGPDQPIEDAADNSANETAARAVVRHHAQLADGLNQRVEVLLQLVDGENPKAEQARQDLLDYLRREILPHARAEEVALYPSAAAQPGGRLLVDGMIAEHRALTVLITELSDTGSLVVAAAAGRAFAALFAVHLDKENDLVLPLLVAASQVSLADILAGMHELLGADDLADSGNATDDIGAESSAVDSGGATSAPVTASGCGGGSCGCGNDRADSSAVAPMLSVDTRLDVRDVPRSRRHALVLSTVEALPAGGAVVLVAPHAPRPVLAEIDRRFPAQVRTEWLQSGPEVWQVRLERVAAPA